LLLDLHALELEDFGTSPCRSLQNRGKIMESMASTDRVTVRLADREPESFYDMAHSERSTNVATLERVVCAAVGGKLVLDGLRQRSWRGAAVAIAGGELLRRGMSGHCRLYEALGVSTAVDRALGLPGAREDARTTEHRVMIEAKFPEFLYLLWKQPETIGKVMGQFADVSWSGPDRSHWRVRTPLGKSFEWEAWTVEDREDEAIRWGAPSPLRATGGRDRRRPRQALGHVPRDAGREGPRSFQGDRGEKPALIVRSPDRSGERPAHHVSPAHRSARLPRAALES
jgi:uncharacterized membrane protein